MAEIAVTAKTDTSCMPVATRPDRMLGNRYQYAIDMKAEMAATRAYMPMGDAKRGLMLVNHFGPMRSSPQANMARWHMISPTVSSQSTFTRKVTAATTAMTGFALDAT